MSIFIFFDFLLLLGWIQNINSITIVIGAALLALFLAWIRRKTQTTALLRLQYESGWCYWVAFRLLILPVGRDRSHSGNQVLYGIFLVVYNLSVSSGRGIID